MAIEVFNRYENKYLLDADTFRALSDRLAGYMECDEYNKRFTTYPIANLYYDTADNHLIRTSLSKPKYKEKLRLRAYGVPETGAKIYAEIKKSVAGLTNKRRSALLLDEAYTFLQTGILPDPQPYQNRQVLREIQYMLQTQVLKPTLYLAYDRRAYFSVGQRDLRISFDCNIRTRRYDLRLEAGDYGSPLLEKGKWLMEVKSAQSIPVWLSELLSQYEVYPVSFSKYGKEYMQTLKTTQPAIGYRFTAAPSLSPLSAAANA